MLNTTTQPCFFCKKTTQGYVCPECQAKAEEEADPHFLRVIIAGGRTFADYALLKQKADAMLINHAPNIVIISGTAGGADKLGERYAKENNYVLKKFPADWSLYGTSAGYKRNQQMAEHADALIAFWDGESKGTKHMIDIATAKGLKVRVVKYNTKTE